MQRGADPTGVVSEIQKEGKLKIKPHENASPENETVHMAREGNDVVKELEKIGEDSGVGEEGTNGGEEGADKTKKGKEAETGEKRQRPTGIPEKEPQHVEEHGKEVEAEKSEAKKPKKDSEKVQEQKPVKKGRQAKMSAKAKIQTAETTPTKKRGVGRPRKSTKETRAGMNEPPVDDVQAATVKPVN